MKRITLNTSEQMLFALLRSSLHEKEVETYIFQNLSEEDWKKCYNLATGGTPEQMDAFNREWISLCRNKLKDNGTIWISGTYHNIFSVANALTENYH